jgi:hypothetical protein
MAKTELKTDAANVALRAAAIVGVMYGFGGVFKPRCSPLSFRPAAGLFFTPRLAVNSQPLKRDIHALA